MTTPTQDSSHTKEGSLKKDYSKYNRKWLHIKVTLPKDDEELFERFKEEKKFTTNNEAMRYCFYHTVKCEKEQKEIKIDSSLNLVIDDLLRSRFYKHKYAIFSKNDFINRAVLRLINEIKTEINLQNMAFRNSLPETEKKVAQALIELHYQSVSYGTTLKMIMGHLESKTPGITEENLKGILFSFIERQLLVQERVDDEVYYAIPA